MKFQKKHISGRSFMLVVGTCFSIDNRQIIKVRILLYCNILICIGQLFIFQCQEILVKSKIKLAILIWVDNFFKWIMMSFLHPTIPIVSLLEAWNLFRAVVKRHLIHLWILEYIFLCYWFTWAICHLTCSSFLCLRTKGEGIRTPARGQTFSFC
jgi:hypothetical protein